MQIIKIAALFILFLASCATSRYRKNKSLIDASAVIYSFRAIGDLNDSYFTIKENNYFEYYRLLFDSIPNSNYAGEYVMKNDTFLLDFYDKKGEQLLGKKALINKERNEIVFFNNYPGIKKKLVIN
jgi:hypothetical protein